MKFLKALKKIETEQPSAISAEEVLNRSENNDQSNGHSESILNKADLKIGAPITGARDSTLERREAESPEDAIEASSVALKPAMNLVGLPDFSVDPARVNPHLVAITHPNTAFSEEYRSLRTQLMHLSQRSVLQSIVVASAGPGEGKSVTALNLSWLLAQTEGNRILLIDGDLRMPSLANYLGFETENGLSQVLAGALSFNESIIKLQPAGLYLVPGGRTRDDVAEMISGPRLGEILEEARPVFDYVIIDAPPLGVFSDAAILINNSDGALLVVRADHTRYKDIERTLESLPREKMLGVVLNQSEDVLLGNSYYDYPYARAYLS